jgi:hypothetical protein
MAQAFAARKHRLSGKAALLIAKYDQRHQQRLARLVLDIASVGTVTKWSRVSYRSEPLLSPTYRCGADCKNQKKEWWA